MKSTFLPILFLVLLPGIFHFTWAQGNSCESLEPFCAGDQELVFENSNYLNSNQVDGEPGPEYDCLLSQPYPAWFYLQIEEEGTLNFTISQFQNEDGSGARYDVDFVVWGPFSRTDDYCSDESLSLENVIDCSYEPDPEEQMTIPDALAGDIYVVLITNFETQPGYISLQQNNSDQEGAGSTDCTILDSALGDDIILCGESETVLDGTTEGATDYEWYFFNEEKDEYEQIPGENDATLTVNTSGNYRVVVFDELNDETDEDDINVNFYPEPVVNAPEDFFVCEEDLRNLDLSILDEEIMEGNTDAEEYRVIYYETFDAIENNQPINNPGSYEIEESLDIWAVVQGLDSRCTSEPVEVSLVVNEFPGSGVQEVTIICADPDGNILSPVEIGEDLGTNYGFEWSLDGEVVSRQPVLVIDEIPETPEINLTITDLRSQCAQTFSSIIEVYSAPDQVEVEIEGNDFEDGYTVTAEPLAGFNPEGVYEFRLDEGPWQESNIFRRVPPGVHNITAREINGCGETTSEDFDLVGYPRFFTPNGDGINDFWQIEGDETVRVNRLYIFDRYGKLLKELNPDGAGWDGTFDGRQLPEDDYWFKLEYLDVNSGRNRGFGGHFTLKR